MGLPTDGMCITTTRVTTIDYTKKIISHRTATATSATTTKVLIRVRGGGKVDPIILVCFNPPFLRGMWGEEEVKIDLIWVLGLKITRSFFVLFVFSRHVYISRFFKSVNLRGHNKVLPTRNYFAEKKRKLSHVLEHTRTHTYIYIYICTDGVDLVKTKSFLRKLRKI